MISLIKQQQMKYRVLLIFYVLIHNFLITIQDLQNSIRFIFFCEEVNPSIMLHVIGGSSSLRERMPHLILKIQTKGSSINPTHVEGRSESFRSLLNFNTLPSIKSDQLILPIFYQPLYWLINTLATLTEITKKKI